ncbi:MAG: dolichyl-phosphate beta-D-mannosyltransferase [Acidiferrobacteraceae bacterium]|nr:dolichyl-phosphate beta-D-mannosyltransferase [Acidiferrobacteraceae bacterium]
MEAESYGYIVTEDRSVVVIPTYNERANILALIEAIHLVLPSIDVLVVDDNSPDGTGSLVTNKAALDHRVYLHHRHKKVGLGAAYIAGFDWALDRGYSYIFQMDADFSHDPQYLPMLLEAAKTNDIAIGSRWVRGGGVRGWTLKRHILSRCANLYARLVLNVSIHDITAGYKCLRRDALYKIGTENISSLGYGVQVELVWRATQHNLSIIEIPIIFKDRVRGRSKLNRHTFIEALSLVWKLRFFQKKNE